MFRHLCQLRITIGDYIHVSAVAVATSGYKHSQSKVWRDR